MRFLTNIKEYQKHENLIIKNNRKDVANANTTILKWLLGIGLLSFSLLFILTFFADTYTVMQIPYIILIVILLVLYIMTRFYPQIPALLLLYCGYAALMAVATYTSSYLNYDDAVSALALIFLFQIPIVILDKSWRVSLAGVTFTAIYILFIIRFKDASLIVDELVNSVVFGLIGIILGTYLRKTQLDNYDLKRQAVIREYTDELTNLSNRRKLYDEVIACEASSQKCLVTGIIMIDIDNFKLYNDTYGHLAGDECLRKIGSCLQSESNKHAVSFYRYGGEEFIGTSCNYDPQQLHSICQDIAASVYRLQIPHEKSLTGFVTVSIGTAAGSDKESLNFEHLVQKADSALYAAKGSGKNKAVIYRVCEEKSVNTDLL